MLIGKAVIVNRLKAVILAGLTTTGALIAAPIVESLVNDGVLPKGIGAILLTLWGWLSAIFIWLAGESSISNWILLGTCIFLIYSASHYCKLILKYTTDSNSEDNEPPTLGLTSKQLKVFYYIGQAIDNREPIDFDSITKATKLSILSAEKTLL